MRTRLISIILGLSLAASAVASADTGQGNKVWQDIQDMFSFGTPITPSIDTDPDAQDFWIDGDFVKYQLGFYVQQWAGGKFQKALDLLQGVKLTRSPKELKIAIYFNAPFQIDLEDPEKARNFELYRVHMPQTIRANLVVSNGSLYLSGLAQRQGDPADRIYLQVEIPLVPDTIYLRRMQFELDSGMARLEAGVLGNSVALIGRANLFADEIKPKFEFWSSIGDSLGLVRWPKHSTAFKKGPVRNSLSEPTDRPPLN